MGFAAEPNQEERFKSTIENSITYAKALKCSKYDLILYEINFIWILLENLYCNLINYLLSNFTYSFWILWVLIKKQYVIN